LEQQKKIQLQKLAQETSTNVQPPKQPQKTQPQKTQPQKTQPKQIIKAPINIPLIAAVAAAALAIAAFVGYKMIR